MRLIEDEERRNVRGKVSLRALTYIREYGCAWTDSPQTGNARVHTRSVRCTPRSEYIALTPRVQTALTPSVRPLYAVLVLFTAAHSRANN